MLEAFIIGFWKVLAWPAFGYMLLGIAIGFWVGLLPGIGGLATLALMLPFSSLFFVASLKYLPLAEATAINYSTPVIVVILAVLSAWPAGITERSFPADEPTAFIASQGGVGAP